MKRTVNVYELPCLCGHRQITNATEGTCPVCGRKWEREVKSSEKKEVKK